MSNVGSLRSEYIAKKLTEGFIQTGVCPLHSPFPIPHSSFPIPHSTFPIPHSTLGEAPSFHIPHLSDSELHLQSFFIIEEGGFKHNAYACFNGFKVKVIGCIKPCVIITGGSRIHSCKASALNAPLGDGCRIG